jgi:hypothetical protein
MPAPKDKENSLVKNPLASLMGKAMARKLVNISEYIVSFNVKNFLKFWIYHLLFFYIGLFTDILIVLVDSFSLVNNMGFMFTGALKANFIT